MLNEPRIINELTPIKIFRLVVCVEQFLQCHDGLRMWIEPPNNLKIDFIRREGGKRGFYLKVNASYFTRREAISFYPDGVIGFCGWASANNRKPFTDAFNSWAKLNFPEIANSNLEAV